MPFWIPGTPVAPTRFGAIFPVMSYPRRDFRAALATYWIRCGQVLAAAFNSLMETWEARSDLLGIQQSKARPRFGPVQASTSRTQFSTMSCLIGPDVFQTDCST